MPYTEFLEALGRASPSCEELREYGLDENETRSIQRSFRPVSRGCILSASVISSELEKMVLEHDCSTIEVGLVRFFGQPEVHLHGVAVAVHEIDPIVVRNDGTIAVYDHAAPNFAVLECAINSEHFLDALATFFAGGDDYEKFYCSLCGLIAKD